MKERRGVTYRDMEKNHIFNKYSWPSDVPTDGLNTKKTTRWELKIVYKNFEKIFHFPVPPGQKKKKKEK